VLPNNNKSSPEANDTKRLKPNSTCKSGGGCHGLRGGQERVARLVFGPTAGSVSAFVHIYLPVAVIALR